VNRAEIPKPGPLADVSLLNSSQLTEGRLRNGLRIIHHGYNKLPIVYINFVFGRGASFDPVHRPGGLSMLYEMIDEGTQRFNALEISEAFEYLGTSFGTWVTHDSGGLTLQTLTDHLSSSLAIVADLLQNPVFPENEFERVRRTILTSLLQEADQPNVVATKTLTKILFGRTHPYGYTIRGTEESIQAITPDEIRTLYAAHMTPVNCTAIVVGNCTFDEIITEFEKTFLSWKGSDIPPEHVADPDFPGMPAIYIVDRPGAAQSQIRVGHEGIYRTHEAYIPVLVMNQILGGQFTSRINMNLREKRGYTYGASSVWEARKFSGHFMTTGGFQGEYTDRAIEELIREITSVRDGGVLPEELQTAKDGLIRALPRQFETPSHIAVQLASLVVYGLPDDYFETYLRAIMAAESEQILAAAKNYLHPDKAQIVVVGNGDVLLKPLQNLKLGEVKEVTEKG
jgi:zinc protease